ncbi:hypothetical protein V8F20_001697 [Naviculisporaceae sp. PSN 640]
MGKPSPLYSDEGADAVSLHTQRGGGESSNHNYLDDDAPELQVDDLPPLYDEVAASEPSAPLLGPEYPVPADRPEASPHDGIDSFWRDPIYGTEYYITSLLDNDPKLLEKKIHEWARKPPRVSVRLHGYHRQTVDKNGKKETETVTDFDVSVNLTPFLYSDATRNLSWRELNTVDNTRKVKRGTVFRRRAPGAKRGIELGLPEKPTLEEWCHRYCANHSGLKCFVLERRMTGFNYEDIKSRLEALVRGTNYHGSLSITFPVKDQYVYVYNESKINIWRRNKWIRWFCYITCLWVLIWPYLFFRTKVFEVVFADWPFSVPDANDDNRRKYVSINEAQWYNMWGRAIYRAVLGKRQCTLDQNDLVTAELPNPTFGNAAVDGAMGFIRAGIGAMNEVNRTVGWGYDS